jgi:hypothetical protein
MTIRWIYILLVLVLLSCNENKNNQSGPQNGKGKLRFTELSYNFGELHQGDVVGHRFALVNEGCFPVVIHEVEHGCGCTDALFPKSPIGPSDTAYIEVVFDTNGWSGRQVKQVVVLANDSIQKHELLIWASIK